MQLFKFVLFKLITASIAFSSDDFSEKTMSLTETEQTHATVNGILLSILNNRDFGSNFVTFGQWESPAKELYIIPSINSNDDDKPALGLGYRLVNADDQIVKTPEIKNVVKIEEKNVVAAGFPLGWFNHQDEKNDDFPFSSKQYILTDVDEEYIKSNKLSLEDLKKMAVQLKNHDQKSLRWIHRDDECNIDPKISKLFDSDYFLFVGENRFNVASFWKNNNSNVDRDDSMDKIEITDLTPTSSHLLTAYTTTTVTSTHELTVTHTMNVPAEIQSSEEPDFALIITDLISSSSVSLKHDTTKSNESFTTEIESTPKLPVSTTSSNVLPEVTIIVSETPFAGPSKTNHSTTMIVETSMLTANTSLLSTQSLSDLVTLSLPLHQTISSSNFASRNSSTPLVTSKLKQVTSSSMFDSTITKTLPVNSSSSAISENGGNNTSHWSSFFGIILAIFSSILLI